ncbi:MAG TPA: hypothetical protein VJP45_12030 [Candidatus Limnocylindria bacterium]|nr:hypothetical protein [Candidatus Limnocylindria bacterium]
MRPLRTRLVRAVVAALMILAVTASVASADDGVTIDTVPYDPGLPSISE